MKPFLLPVITDVGCLDFTVCNVYHPGNSRLITNTMWRLCRLIRKVRRFWIAPAPLLMQLLCHSFPISFALHSPTICFYEGCEMATLVLEGFAIFLFSLSLVIQGPSWVAKDLLSRFFTRTSIMVSVDFFQKLRANRSNRSAFRKFTLIGAHSVLRLDGNKLKNEK